MAVYLYNGVPMKQLPEWDKAACPYAYLANATLFEFDHYMLRVMDRRGYMYERDGQLILGSEGPPYIGEWIIPKAEAATTGEWTVYAGMGQIDIESELPHVFWSNTDIKKGDGSLYMAASEPVLAEPSNPDEPTTKLDLKSWVRGYLLGLSGPMRASMSSGGSGTQTPNMYSYNGVTLPVLPEYDSITYPYVIITAMNTNGILCYQFHCCATPILYDGSKVTNSDYGVIGLATFMTGAWTDITYRDNDMLSIDYDVVWCNDTIMSTDGTVYMETSKPVPVC